jgi:site-specific DNA recombinase
MIASTVTRQLRFAVLNRVSTEKQEKQGESLRIQRQQKIEDVARLESKIVAWYGGQESATPGHEKIEVDRLLSDAAKGMFDAVMVSHPDRWSRDNAKSKAGLEILRRHHIRFFVGTQEFDLFNPIAKLWLGMSAEIGEFSAGTQNQKSTDSRIERAKRGVPTGGKLPFGRLFDKKTETWSIDPNKQAVVKDVARRFLATPGESLADLAEEYGMNHSNLHKVMTKRCGENWEIAFDVANLNISENIPVKVPRLLPDSIIEQILKKVAAKKTYSHGHIKHRYLLARMIFCGHCNYTMFGQTNHPKTSAKQYYRHAHAKRERKCTCAESAHKWLDAEVIERNVMHELFQMFGNPAAVQRAIERAVPDRQKVKGLRDQHARLESAIQKSKSSIQRVVDLVADGTIQKDEAQVKLTELRQQGEKQHHDLAKVNAQLEGLPSPDVVKAVSGEIVDRFQRAMFPSLRHERKIGLLPVADKSGEIDYSASLTMRIDAADADEAIRTMTWEDKRRLLELVFSMPLADGRRAGVYVEWLPTNRNSKPKWKYSIRGHLNKEHLAPWSVEQLNYFESDCDDDESQPLSSEQLRKMRKTAKKLNGKRCSTKCASHLPGTIPPEHRCHQGISPLAA